MESKLCACGCGAEIKVGRKYSPDESIHCYGCGEPLISGINWYASSEKSGNRLCKLCISKAGKKWNAENAIRHRANAKRWREANPEWKRANDGWWYDHNKEKHAATTKRYREANWEEVNAERLKWQKENPEKHNASSRKWNHANPERTEANRKRWQAEHPERYAELQRIAHDKRRRGLPTNIILGKHFKGSHLHHLTPNVAVYIPSTLHRSIYHNIWTGQNMDEINSLAMEWYERGGPINP